MESARDAAHHDFELGGDRQIAFHRLGDFFKAFLAEIGKRTDDLNASLLKHVHKGRLGHHEVFRVATHLGERPLEHAGDLSDRQ